MRCLAIAAVAALSAIGAQAAVMARGNFVIFNFDILHQATCDFPDSQVVLGSEHLDSDHLSNFRQGPKCLGLGAGAVSIKELGDGCQLFFYVDEECQTSPAAPPQGQCVFNEARFKSFQISCLGLVM